MRKHSIPLLLLTLVLGMGLASSVSAFEEPVYEAGYVDWEINPIERLYVEGMDETDAVLQRQKSDNAPGGISINSGFSGQILNLNSEPIQNGFSTTVNMSVFFSVYLDQGAGPQTCVREEQFNLDGTTTLIYSVDAGGVPVYDSVITQVVDKVNSNEAMNFSGELNEINLTMQEGDVFTLTVSIEHQCTARARVQWGALEQNGGGILIKGEIYEPEGKIIVDESRRAHIEFEPLFPWGGDDVKEVKWEIWGPLEDYERTPYSLEGMMENSIGRTMTIREIDENESIWTWSGQNELTPGLTNLQFCITTISGDSNSQCHAFGIIKFDIEKENQGFANAKLFLTLSCFVALGIFLWNIFNQGLMLPLPILGALVVMMLLFIPTVFDQANLGADAAIDENTRVSNAELLDENGEIYSISDLIGKKSALIIGIGLPASENLIDQSNQFNQTIEHFGEDIAVVHILSGMDPLASDIIQLKQQINSSWPVLIDADEAFASGLPNGVSDSVVVIDPAMHVTYSKAPVAFSKEIIESIDEISFGGSQNSGAYFSLLLGPGLFLIFLALPREDWTPPEQPLPPGTLWASIVGASALGIFVINLPLLIATLLPISSDILFWIDIVIMLWFVEMSIVTARKGKPYEATILAKSLHRLFPESFQNWRPLEDMERDVLLGIWFAWFGILAFPSLFTQGVAASMLSGFGGIISGSLNLILYLFLGGLSILFLRLIAAVGGPVSRVFGRYGAESFTQFVGWCLVPISLWVTTNAIITSSLFGIV